MQSRSNGLDEETRELINQLVPPPRSRRATLATLAAVGGLAIVVVVAWHAGVFIPRVSLTGTWQTSFDQSADTASFTVEVRNDGLVAADVEEVRLIGPAGPIEPKELRDVTAALGRGGSANITVVIDGVCALGRVDFVELRVTPSVPITQTVTQPLGFGPITPSEGCDTP